MGWQPCDRHYRRCDAGASSYQPIRRCTPLYVVKFRFPMCSPLKNEESFGVRLTVADNQDLSEVQKVLKEFGPIVKLSRSFRHNHFAFAYFSDWESATNFIRSPQGRQYSPLPAKPSLQRDKTMCQGNLGGPTHFPKGNQTWKQSPDPLPASKAATPKVQPTPKIPDDPPPLVDASDLLAKLTYSPLDLVYVLFMNLPFVVTQAMLYELCLRTASVVSVELIRKTIDGVNTVSALVGVTTERDASLLESNLNGKRWMWKRIVVKRFSIK